MALHVFVPPQSLPQEEASKAFVYAQCLLVNKTTRSSSPDDRYRQFLCDAQEALFCTLDASGTSNRDLTGPFRDTASAVLKDILPSNIAFLDPMVTALLLPHTGSQSLLDPGVSEFSEQLFTVTKPQRRNDSTIAEAFFLSTPEWSPPIFEAYHLKIESRKERQGILGILLQLWREQEEKFYISGTCHYTRFFVNTPMIIPFMKKDAETNITSFLSRAITHTAIPVSDVAANQDTAIPVSDVDTNEE